MVCPELEDDYLKERIELGDERIELDRICIYRLISVISSYDTDDWTSSGSDLLGR
jgi:hypothetical protein